MIRLRSLSIVCEQDGELEVDVASLLVSAQGPNVQFYVGGMQLLALAVPARLESIIQSTCTFLYEIKVSQRFR